VDNLFDLARKLEKSGKLKKDNTIPDTVNSAQKFFVHQLKGYASDFKYLADEHKFSQEMQLNENQQIWANKGQLNNYLNVKHDHGETHVNVPELKEEISERVKKLVSDTAVALQGLVDESIAEAAGEKIKE
jgi:hypothetical protein